MVGPLGPLPSSATATTEDEEDDKDEEKAAGRGPNDDRHVRLFLLPAGQSDLQKNNKNNEWSIGLPTQVIEIV